ncbi:EAL domain-containing protein (plasmid) [Cellulomonas sp. WB94]|uniref:putative bifunctional diguanylate cyclase/phosphodiesterase n=1 Tax=Cellulomonas sp. WB94 TaxID=2173174 RepID=UPI000D56FF83|nr:EAL domain-containing protein [Cellulomonas sp. WB94]PVU81429.1 EAL domain-containing protein [Cellulomonas sp. WB94]
MPTQKLTEAARPQTTSRVRERIGRGFDTSLRTGASFATALVVLGVAAAWLGTYEAGGTKTVLPQLFYLPIVFAASRFGWRGTLVTAVVAGVLAGPVMPLDVIAGTPQSVAAWAARLLMFLTIGLLVAWLSGESSDSIISSALDARGAHNLRRALDRFEFDVHYQPIVNLRTGRTTGFEALCRWQDPARGTVPPSAFIPLAERTGTIIPIGAFVLREAAQQCATWEADGVGDLIVAVNVSAHQLSQPDFFTQVRDVLHDAGLRPSQLCIEITETAIVRDRPTALQHINALHDMGVCIALDDFGTGQASLAYLQDFPVDVLKIDLSFISTVDTDQKSATLVAGIIQLARALGASTIAEGIERPAQLETLRALGCSYGQGYHLGRPCPPPLIKTNTGTTG